MRESAVERGYRRCDSASALRTSSATIFLNDPAASVQARGCRRERGRGRGGGCAWGRGTKKIGRVCMHFCAVLRFPAKAVLRRNGGARAAPRPLDEWLLGHWGARASVVPRETERESLEWPNLSVTRLRGVRYASVTASESVQDTF